MNKKRVLFLMTIVLFILGCVKTETEDLAKEPKFMPAELSDTSCSTDDNCLEVGVRFDQNNCCLGCETEAINTQTAKLRKQWTLDNCGSLENSAVSCPLFECIFKDEIPAVCNNNHCEKIK